MMVIVLLHIFGFGRAHAIVILPVTGFPVIALDCGFLGNREIREVFSLFEREYQDKRGWRRD